MLENDFFNIKHFTKAEVERTGADIKDVKYETIQKLDIYRDLIKCPVRLLHNGLTTGDHKSPEHPAGYAVDHTLELIRPPSEVIKKALKSGFQAIGIYWNSIMFSYHFAITLDTEFKFWSGIKKQNGSWKYGALILDPSQQ